MEALADFYTESWMIIVHFAPIIVALRKIIILQRC